MGDALVDSKRHPPSLIKSSPNLIATSSRTGKRSQHHHPPPNDAMALLAKRPAPLADDQLHPPDSKRLKTTATSVLLRPFLAFTLPYLRAKVAQPTLTMDTPLLGDGDKEAELARGMDELGLGPTTAPPRAPAAAATPLLTPPAAAYNASELRPSALWDRQEAEKQLVATQLLDAMARFPSSALSTTSTTALQRQHIFHDQYQQTLKASKKDVVERARREVTDRGTQSSRPSNAVVASPLSPQASDYRNYLQTILRLNEQEGYETVPSAKEQERQTKAKKRRAAESQMDRVIRMSKAALESPLPVEPFLPSAATLRLRNLALDDSFTKPKPRLRKWRSALLPDQLEVVKQAFAKRGQDEVSVMTGAIVTGRDIQKLKPGQWLNDESINFYGVLLNQRALQAEKEGGDELMKSQALLKIHCFSTFLMSTFEKKKHDGVKKWTKKIDLFSKDMIIVPLNLGNAHWACGAINVRQKRFEYYDSMGSKNYTMLQRLREYIESEHLAKKSSKLDTSNWIDHTLSDLPQQNNGSDCGVFVSQFMDCLSRSWKGSDTVFDFSCENMPYIRQKLVYELVTQKLNPEPWA